MTGAGDLPVDLLVHAIVSSEAERVSREGVRRAFAERTPASACLADRRGRDASFGLGAGNLDMDESAQLMADELARHLDASPFPTRVTLVAETPDEALALESAVSRSLPDEGGHQAGDRRGGDGALAGWSGAADEAELFRPHMDKLGEAGLRVTPGASYYAVLQQGQQIGFASSTIDTTDGGISVRDYLGRRPAVARRGCIGRRRARR